MGTVVIPGNLCGVMVAYLPGVPAIRVRFLLRVQYLPFSSHPLHKHRSSQAVMEAAIQANIHQYMQVDNVAGSQISRKIQIHHVIIYKLVDKQAGMHAFIHTCRHS